MREWLNGAFATIAWLAARESWEDVTGEFFRAAFWLP
jgi:hypothetical protein